VLESDKEVVRLIGNAAEDLGFCFSAPYQVIDVDGSVYNYLGHINDFGSDAGILIGGGSCPEGNSREREFALSLFGPECVETSDQVKALLIDWGWFGPEERRPKWFENGSHD